MQHLIAWVIVCAGPWVLFLGITYFFDQYGCDLNTLFGAKSRTRKARRLKFGRANIARPTTGKQFIRSAEEMERLLSL